MLSLIQLLVIEILATKMRPFLFSTRLGPAMIKVIGEISCGDGDET
jgi:7-keto-8-aminopelargonate synthetase-like enzyme